MRTCTTRKTITLAVEIELPVTIRWEETDHDDGRTWLEPVSLEADASDAELAASIREALRLETASDYASDGDVSHADDGGCERDMDDDAYIEDRWQDRADERSAT